MTVYETSRELPASPEEIFAAFSMPERLARWWGPSGFTNTFEQFDFRPHGRWSFIMHGPDGINYPNEIKFLDIIVPEKIVIRHVSQPLFTLTITVKGSKGGTTIHWAQQFDDEEVARNIAHIVVPGNEQNLDRLTAVVCSS